MSGSVDEATSAAPIFIVGAPRSGTSLLRNMLGRHPAIGLCGETYFFYYVYARRRAFGDLARPTARRRLVDSYLATRRWRRAGVPLDNLAEALMREGTSYDAFFLALLRFYAAFHGKRRYGEKTPGHALDVGTLAAWYPGGRIVHVIRDPRDVVASLLRMPWGSANALVNARVWRAHVTAAENAAGRGNYLAVRYERLVADPESELRRACAFIGEEYDAAMATASPAPAPEAWWFARALEPVTTARHGAWRDQLTSDDVATIEWAAGPLMRRLGYEPEQSPLGEPSRLRAGARAAWESLGSKVRQVPRMWYTWARPTELAAEEARIERGWRRPTG